MVIGVDHLLHLGRGAGGKRGAESDELQMACLMGLVSFLAMVPEVQRVSPFHASELKNAVAGAIVQSGNIEDKPLTAAGLDGTGEIVQVNTYEIVRIVLGLFFNILLFEPPFARGMQLFLRRHSPLQPHDGH